MTGDGAARDLPGPDGGEPDGGGPDRAGPAAELLAGGTDLMERRSSGISTGPVIDISGTPGLGSIDWAPDGSASIGALVTVDGLATDPRVRRAYPGLADAAAGLATPQIRRVATLGGNLMQRTRCWYYRHPDTSCLKKGGDTCPARDGNHLYGVAVDRGPCVWPHPSTLAAALLAHQAQVEVQDGGRLSVDDLYGDGSDGTRDHQLPPGQVLARVVMPVPVPGERAGYVRAISRAHAEWPLVEVVARLAVTGGLITLARVAVGGVAPVPIRSLDVEAELAGAPATAVSLARAAERAAEGAAPLPQTGYKLDLIRGTVLAALERCLGRPGRS